MDGSAQNFVRVEKESQAALAAIWDGGELGTVLGQLLEKQGIRVEKINSGSTFLDSPRYIFFFLTNQALNQEWKNSLEQLISSASLHQSKTFLILDNVSEVFSADAEKIAQDHSWPTCVVEIKGRFGGGQDKMVEAMGKIVRIAFSTRSEKRVVILGEDVPVKTMEEYQYFPTIVENQEQSATSVQWNDYSHSQNTVAQNKTTSKKRINKKNGGLGKIILLIFFILLLPVFILGGEAILGLWNLKQVQLDLTSGKYFEARAAADQAQNRFKQSEEIIGLMSNIMEPVGLGGINEKIYELFHTGELGANSLYRVAGIVPTVMAIPKTLLGNGEDLDLSLAGKQLSLEAGAIDQNLGFIEAEWESGNLNFLTTISGAFGVSGTKLSNAFEKIGIYRQLIRNGVAAMTVLPEVTGTSDRKTYLVVFQNSAELRPTGGFIGSYAVVHFDGGKLLDYKINDIYSADGQLRGRVEPPDEILHYLGQPNWFMRDANFAADFPLTAKRLEWFLEKETGENVDGVIAVNLGAVQKILAATGGVTISGVKEKITADNFFQKAEFASEINFFPGSTQKKDFLGQVGDALLSQITGESAQNNWLALGQNLQSSLEQKDLMFYFNSTAVQNVIENGSWGGAIRTRECASQKHNCLMVVEANFGANKSNFFVKQSLEHNFLIGKGGGVVDHVTLNIRNESPSESWPGGTYKNYIRLLAPIGTKLSKIDLGDGRKATVSGILTEQVLAKVQKNQFLVFNNLEGAVVDQVATTSGYTSFGALVLTPIQSNSTISWDLEMPNILDFSKTAQSFETTILKQPGNAIDSLTVSIEYPSFLTAAPDPSQTLIPLASEQKLVYNSDLLVDRSFKVNFKR